MCIAYFQLYDHFLMTIEEWNIYNRLNNFMIQPSRSQCLGWMQSHNISHLLLSFVYLGL